ncbi:MAG: NAD(P)/FAD-dependent oxidoreductase [Thermomicrobiales bacterium]
MRTADVAVVGAGPAGLSAAIIAARAGARTVLLDEQREVGGQLRYRIAELHAGPYGTIRARDLARHLVEEAGAAGVDMHQGAIVWGLFAERTLAIVEGADSYQLQAEQVVLATGSTDRPLPFPGGTLPGVFTARAVQILLNLHRVLPGRRFLVVGGGVEAAEVAEDIALAGGEVVAKAVPDRASSMTAAGTDGVESVMIDGVQHAADVVVVAVGRQPDPELALMAECAAGIAAELGGWMPLRDGRMQSTAPGVLVCGDVAGICDVRIALAEGSYAGCSAAASLGLVDAGTLHRARTAYEAAATLRIRIAESMTLAHVQVERAVTEGNVG